MSTTLPPAAGLLLPAVLPLLPLLLLLQAVAASAIAAMAAIAGVRLMFFLSSIEISGQDPGPGNVATGTQAGYLPTLAAAPTRPSIYLPRSTDPTERTSVYDKDPPLTAVVRQQVCSDQAVLARRACQIPVSWALPAGNETVSRRQSWRCLQVFLVVEAGQPAGQPVDGGLEVGELVHEIAQALGQPGHRDLLVAAP